MAYLLLFALAILVSMFTNFAGPKFDASAVGQRFGTSYPFRTLKTALVIFAGIVLASFVMSAAYKKPMLPSA
jgi:hypothetical protein